MDLAKKQQGIKDLVVVITMKSLYKSGHLKNLQP